MKKEIPAAPCFACGKLWSHDCPTCTAAVLRSGSPPELPTDAEREARSWAKIEAWLITEANQPLRSISVTPLHGKGNTPAWYVTLSRDDKNFSGTTRLDALAQAAQWCELELKG